MRVLTCLYHDHNLWIVALAAAMCLIGSLTSVKMFQRTFAESGAQRYQWCFLSAFTAGSAIWATHFIAMLGYRPGVPVTLDGTLTVLSALIAVVGTGVGLLVASSRNRFVSVVTGGGIIGLSIAAMHYVGMFAYRADGIVTWLPEYVIASLVLAAVLSSLVVSRIRKTGLSENIWLPSGLFAAAIVSLHFTGMAAFTVVPLPGVQVGADSETFTALAAAIAMAALIIIGAGLSTHLVERRTRSKSREQLHHIALHDALTEVPNRRAFSEALNVECDKLTNGGGPFALLLVDLDRFKPVNDTLGHPIGDVVLQKVASRLNQAVRKGDLVARIGGDEFAIIAYDLASEDEARAVAERVVEILRRPFVIQGQVAEIGASVGIGLAPGHANDPETLVQYADIALYTAKRTEGRGCRVFDPTMQQAIQRRRFLETDLRRACMREDFKIAYQPVIDSASGAYTGAEALLRWTCPERGDVPPSEFIPIAEELGLISRIGAGVLKQACLDAASWPEHIDLAVNISAVQLRDPRLHQTVMEALKDSGFPATRLELEITETALLGNDETVMHTLTQLHDSGIRISLDDFGTGYSSLSYLHRFPITRIKIDKSFVQQLPSDAGSASIVRAITQLGASLHMKTTAEGIETDEQMAFIAEHGCNDVQGFLFSRPVNASSIGELFHREKGQAAA
ncbi:putative bifunctional diguanylate cyclase/phosphodiesterase [Sphingorhabdus sp. SMR4y]|uniref:putative bifunctional diguanylate cyclase/phosphodiesterase n=1 Tax=Sphingorhabdus sp. SMR4y TaxID=2584094 RepID=UPI000B5C7502|nr:bifunctional diguanylate cyclase/phosphodiesterase [Sphingorhabdus sp. SMR4y]ASK87929.1 putative signaling protein [Sphingorhabdus sp. SMR4y]